MLTRWRQPVVPLAELLPCDPVTLFHPIFDFTAPVVSARALLEYTAELGSAPVPRHHRYSIDNVRNRAFGELTVSDSIDRLFEHVVWNAASRAGLVQYEHH